MNIDQILNVNKIRAIIMYNKLIILIIISIVITVSISGCTTSKNATNGTFGEKSVSIKNITIINTTSEETTHDDTSYWLVYGHLKNNNQNDVFNLKMKVTAYDAEGNVVAVNDTVHLEPKVISPEGEALYYFTLNNKDKKIVRYELQLISVDSKAA